MLAVLLQELLVALRVWLLAGVETRWAELSDEAKVQLVLYVMGASMLLFIGYYVKVHQQVDTIITQSRKTVASSSPSQVKRRKDFRTSSAPFYRRGNNMTSEEEGEGFELRSRSHSQGDEDNFGIDGTMSWTRDRGSPSSSGRGRTNSSDSERDMGGGGAVFREIPRDLMDSLRERNSHLESSSPQGDMSMISSIADEDSHDSGEHHLNGDPKGIQVIPLDKLHAFMDRFSRNGVIVSVYRKGAFRKRCLKLDPTKRCLYWKDERRVLEMRRKRREWPIDDVVSLVELGAVRTEEITAARKGLLSRIFGGGQELLVARGSGAEATTFTPVAAAGGGGSGSVGSKPSAPGVELRVGSGTERRGSVESGLAALLRSSGSNGSSSSSISSNGLDSSPRAQLDSDTKHAVALKLRSSHVPGKGKVYQMFFESKAEAHWLFRHFASLLYHLRGRAAVSEGDSDLQAILLSSERGDREQRRQQPQGPMGERNDGGNQNQRAYPHDLPDLIGDDDSVETYQTYASSMSNEGFQPPSTNQPPGYTYHPASHTRNPATQTFQSLHRTQAREGVETGGFYVK